MSFASPVRRQPAAQPRAGRLLGLGLLVGLLAACAGAPTPSATPTPTPVTDPTISPSPSPSPSPSASPSGVIVTFDVEGEQYRVLITSAVLIEHAQALLAGGEEGRIPNGLIVRGEPGVNAPWSWHIDPASLEFADMTMEVCDGLPSHVEDGTLAGDRFCPWGAEVIDIVPAD
jgi:hypothetical protein